MGIVTNMYQETKPIQQQIPCPHYILGFRDRLNTICE